MELAEFGFSTPRYRAQERAGHAAERFLAVCEALRDKYDPFSSDPPAKVIARRWSFNLNWQRRGRCGDAKKNRVNPAWQGAQEVRLEPCRRTRFQRV